MNRKIYFDYIEKQMHVLGNRITTGGKLNLLSLHMHSENFYLHFFNLLYGYELENLNDELQNVEAIDLIDHKNKIIIQVSSTNTKQKIESALKKGIFKRYRGYRFKFISIAKDASSLRKMTFKNPNKVMFSPEKDIHDIASVLSKVSGLGLDKFKEVYEFVKKELGGEVDIVKLDSNLATVINILATEQWDDANKTESVNIFEIERKIDYNNLDRVKGIIEEYCFFYDKVNSKYSEFDSFGSNKSNSVLATIKREYLKLPDSGNSDELFFKITGNLKDIVLKSANYENMPIDELDLSIDILVVDAFIRCKIFKNPKDYNYASS
jgi:hypothetical protein